MGCFLLLVHWNVTDVFCNRVQYFLHLKAAQFIICWASQTESNRSCSLVDTELQLCIYSENKPTEFMRFIPSPPKKKKDAYSEMLEMHCYCNSERRWNRKALYIQHCELCVTQFCARVRQNTLSNECAPRVPVQPCTRFTQSPSTQLWGFLPGLPKKKIIFKLATPIGLKRGGLTRR